MTILLYKDGKLIVDTEQPLEGVGLDNLAAILSGASDGDVIQYDATNGMWVNKSAPSSLPEVTASDKGKYLKANESTGDPEWASGGSSGGWVLVVNMVYDEVKDADYTDKTWKEIYDAPMAVIVQELSIASNSTKIIGSVAQVEYKNSEYSVSYYALSPMGEIDVIKLVTDSENGYLTWAE